MQTVQVLVSFVLVLAQFALVSFFFTKLTNTNSIMLVSFWIKKNWTKVTMIMWDPLSKHFIIFFIFQYMSHIHYTVYTSPYHYSSSFPSLFSISSILFYSIYKNLYWEKDLSLYYNYVVQKKKLYNNYTMSSSSVKKYYFIVNNV